MCTVMCVRQVTYRGFVIAVSCLITQLLTNYFSQAKSGVKFCVSFASESSALCAQESRPAGRRTTSSFAFRRNASEKPEACSPFLAVTGQAKTDDVEVFNIPRKQAASTSGTNFELAETYSYEEFASRVVPRRALRHLTASRSPRAFPEPYCPARVLGEDAAH